MRQVLTIVSLVILLSMAWQQSAVAQPYTLDENIVSLQLELRDYPDGDGLRWTTAEGELGTAVQYLHVGGLSARSATEAFLLVLGLEDQATLILAKDNWNQDLEHCTTDESGMCDVGFITHSEVGFKVSGNEGASWQLVVLTSPEVPLNAIAPSPLYAAERENDAVEVPDANGASEGGHNNLLVGVGVGLLAIIAALLLLLLRKKTSTTTIVLFIVFFGLLSVEKEARAEAGSYSATTDARIGALERRARAEEDAEYRKKVLDSDIRKKAEAHVKKASAAYSAMKSRADALISLRDLVGKWINLSACSAVSSPPNMPRIPSFCAVEDGGGIDTDESSLTSCGACYASARGDFEQVRSVFEQLRTIYKCTKGFTDSAIAFGDNASGIHAVTGLVWQAERGKITQQVGKLQKAYDQKFIELSGKLHASMIEISVCEARYGTPDWYDRFGFMYYEFVQEKYKRAD